MKIAKLVATVLVGLLVAALTVPVASAQDARKAPTEGDAPPPAPDELRQSAGDGGTVRVIVELDVPTTPEGALDAAAAASQRGRIADAQAEVVADLDGTGATVTHVYEFIPYVALEADQAALDALASSDAVRGVQEDLLALPTLADSKPIVRAPQAYSLGYTGAGKAIAILDTGVQKNHPFLSGKVVSEACYAQGMNQSAPGGDCPNGQDSMVGNGAGVPCTYSALDCPHGTHVAGIAAGTAGVNGAPSSTGGVARDASIIAINVFSYAGVDSLDRPRAGSWTSDQIKGLERVHQLRNSFDIAAVNMSLGSNETFGSYCDAGQSGMKAAIDLLRSVGIPTVIASGNGGQGLSISAPACISTAVSVGASTDSDTSVTLFSNESFQLNLLAPGETINSSVCTVSGNSCAATGTLYQAFNGTSMAAPHVAGAMAILDQKAGRDTVGRKVALLHETGKVIDAFAGNRFVRINIQAALNAMPATPPNPGFTDVPPSHAFYPDIAWAVAEGITDGFQDKTFRPNGTLRRDAMVAYLYRLAGEPAGPFPNPGFSDVPPSHTFYKEISWAVKEGVTEGFLDGTFRPGEPVTRAAMAAFLWRLQGEPTNPLLNAGPLPNPGFSDVGAGHLFRNPIFWAAYYEITRGYSDGTFKPGQAMKRQEAVAFLYRYVPLEIRT